MKGLGHWRFIDTPDLIRLHAQVMESAHQSASLPSRSCVESCVQNAMNAALYTADNDEPDLLTAVSYLLYYVAKNHCFVDGNKRTAWVAFVHVLWVNGLVVQADQVEAANLVNKIAQSAKKAQQAVREIHAWIQEPERLACA